MRGGFAIAMLTLMVVSVSSCSWVQSHLVPQRKDASSVHSSQSTNKESVDIKENIAQNSPGDDEQSANSIVPTEAQREEAGKLLAEMREDNAPHVEKEGPMEQTLPVLPPGQTRTREHFEKREEPVEQDRGSMLDPAEQRGLRSPGLPKLLPMDIDGKLYNS